MKKVVALIVLLTSVIILLVMLTDKPDEVEIMPLTESWEKAVAYQDIPQGLNSLSAESCGVCHQDHYADWKNSTHANAWTDLQFQSEIGKESSPFLCINCHIPLENQQEYLVEGLVDGDIYQPVRTKNHRWDESLQQEGITCVACHLRGNAIIGPTGSKNAPHRTLKDPEFLSESLCISCHNAVAALTPEIACAFETGDEWKQAGPEKNCISCHMDLTKRPIAFGMDSSMVHTHAFPGSGIPKYDTLETGMLNGLGFYPGDLKKQYKKDAPIEYTFRLKNEFAGHRVPTGDPERFILTSFKVVNTKGEVVWEGVERIGERWQWYPVANKLSDNNVNVGEERVYKPNIDNLAPGSYTFLVEVSKHRMDEETAEYNKLPDSYPRSIVIYERSYNFRITN